MIALLTHRSGHLAKLQMRHAGIFLEKLIRGGKLGFPKIEEGQRYLASGLLYTPMYVASVGKGGSIYETTAGKL